MRKRKTTAEVVRSGDPIASELMLEKLTDEIARRLQYPKNSKAPEEMTVEELSDAALLQPWFLPRAVSNAILRLLPIGHRDKWIYTFEDWGCWKCERKDVIHAGLGLCRRCYSLISSRSKSSIVRRYSPGPSPADLAADLTRKQDSAKQILAEHEIIEAPRTPAIGKVNSNSLGAATSAELRAPSHRKNR